MLNTGAKIAVVGTGRLGSSFAIALAGIGRNVVAVSTRRPEHRSWLRKKLPATLVTDDLRVAASSAEIVFISVSDRYIQEVCDACDWSRDQAVTHCSGVLGLDPLASASQAGARTGAIHPLQTFPSPDSAHLLSGCTFAIESIDDEFGRWLNDCAVELDGHPIPISGEYQRAVYHASAVLACGLLAGLAGIAAEMWSSLGIEREEAIRRIAPMVISTANAVDRHGMPDALTGPYTRGDLDTIRKHLSATFSESPDTSRAYTALAYAQMHIAEEQGNIDDETAAQIRSLLLKHLEKM